MLIILTVVALAIAVRSLRRYRNRRHPNFDALVETVDLLLAAVRAGYSPAQSVLMLADVTPCSVSSVFGALRAKVEAGTPIVDALLHARSELGSEFAPVIDLVVSSIRLGIPTETLMIHLRSESRFVHRHLGEDLARRLSVRLTIPLVLCILPSFVVLIIVPIVMGTIAHLRLNGTTP